MNRADILKGLAACSDFMCKECPFEGYQHVDYKFRCNYKLISAANAEFNKTGTWIKKTWIVFDTEKVGYTCSECNTTWDSPTKHCPNCGIAMDLP